MKSSYTSPSDYIFACAKNFWRVLYQNIMKKSDSFQHLPKSPLRTVCWCTQHHESRGLKFKASLSQMGSCTLSAPLWALNPLHLDEFYKSERCRREGECSHTKSMLHWPGAWENQAIPSKPVKDLICPRQKEAWPVSSHSCCPGIFLVSTLEPRVHRVGYHGRTLGGCISEGGTILCDIWCWPLPRLVPESLLLGHFWAFCFPTNLLTQKRKVVWFFYV